MDAGEKVLRGRGFDVWEGVHVRECQGYLAGNDTDRLHDLEEALGDASTDIVWFARGGYGTQRLLPLLRLPEDGGRKKLIAGFSDATALFLWALKCRAFRLLYAPSVQELGRRGVCDLESLWASLGGSPAPVPAKGPPGRCGPAEIIGGCLSLLSSACGTPWQPETDGKFIFIEDVGEKMYRVDRMLTQLRQAGWFGNPAGVLLGSFTGMGLGESPDDVRRRVAELLPEDTPVIHGLPVGHRVGKHALPFGIPALWDGKAISFQKRL